MELVTLLQDKKPKGAITTIINTSWEVRRSVYLNNGTFVQKRPKEDVVED